MMSPSPSLSLFKQGQAIPFSEGLTIRLIQPCDLDDIKTMLNDSRVNTYLYFAPAPEAVFDAFFTPIIEDTQRAIQQDEWPEHPTAVIRDQSGRYMGMTGATCVMFLKGNYDVGYQLPVHAWGQGIATQACRFMTRLCFEQLNAHKVCADCYRLNTGSWKTLEKCGFTREGCLTQFYLLEQTTFLTAQTSPTEHTSQAEQISPTEQVYTVAQGYDDKLLYGMTAGQFTDQRWAC